MVGHSIRAGIVQARAVFRVGIVSGSLAALWAPLSGDALAASFQDCPQLGPIENYAAGHPPDWSNWDERPVTVTENGEDKEILVRGAVCEQQYPENDGKSAGSILEITENYKQALQNIGAELAVARPGYVSAHLVKNGGETWFVVSATRDDVYNVTEVQVAQVKRSLLPPSGNDFRLLGHMPGAVANPPVKKNFDEHAFPTENGDVAIRGAYYEVVYDLPPARPPARRVTPLEIVENYRSALKDLNAEILRDQPDNISARLDDHGQTVWLYIAANQVIAVDEKPFKLSIKQPTADEMRERLDQAGRIALYVNFDFDKATLKPDSAPVIAQIVELLKRNPDLKVSIEGHTDGIGGHDYNVKLSQDRAASVVASIAAAGIGADRLSSAGFGPDRPVAPNETDEGRAKNRRVELVKG